MTYSADLWWCYEGRSAQTCFPPTILCLASLWVRGRKSPQRSRPPSQAGDVGKQHTGWEESFGVETSHKDTDVHGRGAVRSHPEAMDEGEGIGRQKPNKTVWLGAQGMSVLQQ